MIAVDTSALMAILLNEPEAPACTAALETEGRLLISAGTVAELLIVAGRRKLLEEANALIGGLGFEIIGVTSESARRVADSYARWGKGIHPAALNFGDCFAHAMATEYRCRLLYVGADFARTDIVGVL